MERESGVEGYKQATKEDRCLCAPSLKSGRKMDRVHKSERVKGLQSSGGNAASFPTRNGIVEPD